MSVLAAVAAVLVPLAVVWFLVSLCRLGDQEVSESPSEDAGEARHTEK